VLHRAPADGRIPLGRPIANVTVGVVDAALAPVPLGAPGEIVFTGVCVGRGYVNDPERTRAAFTTDPARPGQRLYRSGDLGRWRPDGKLEFIGRRDAQVKVRGFRIELGEVEDRLSRVPGVAEGAVVVAGEGRGRHLVGFYRPAQGAGPGPEQVRRELATTLPAYMVPGTLHPVAELPLTGNGKVDRKALLRLAGQPALPGEDDRPRTADERRLAAAWAEVLGVPVEQIARTDHFFDRGGTSLSAVQLAIRLDRALTPADLAGAPVLADLAVVVGRGSGGPS
jgi:acyl-coenzyme A synthetase/AMP-(fatty) acid ligase